MTSNAAQEALSKTTPNFALVTQLRCAVLLELLISMVSEEKTRMTISTTKNTATATRSNTAARKELSIP